MNDIQTKTARLTFMEHRVPIDRVMGRITHIEDDPNKSLITMTPEVIRDGVVEEYLIIYSKHILYEHCPATGESKILNN